MAIVADLTNGELIEAIEELSEYLSENEIVTAFNVGNSFFTAAEAWKKLDPKTPEQIAHYYRTTPSLVHQLVFANYGIPHELELINKVRALCKGASSVLDLGGGIGSFLLNNEAKRRVHADFGGHVFNYAKWRYEGLDTENDMAIYMAELEDDYLINPPFGGERFDVVICTEVLEHAVNPEALVELLAELVKPGGKLVATVSFDDVGGTVPQHLNVDRWTDEEFMSTVFPKNGFVRIDQDVFRLEDQ
jgi:2-polyprenyl-3-methyl-5-hydroxy-6-metoxy-1,4-benzoquinol methylase